MSEEASHAEMSRSHVEAMLAHMVTRLSRDAAFGVTLVEDTNGIYGPMGKQYLTVRFESPWREDDLIEVHMELISVSSDKENQHEEEQRSYWKGK